MHGNSMDASRRPTARVKSKRAVWLDQVCAQADTLRDTAFRKSYPEPSLHRTNIGNIRRQRERLQRAISLRDLLDRTRRSAALGAPA